MFRNALKGQTFVACMENHRRFFKCENGTYLGAVKYDEKLNIIVQNDTQSSSEIDVCNEIYQ